MAAPSSCLSPRRPARHSFPLRNGRATLYRDEQSFADGTHCMSTVQDHQTAYQFRDYPSAVATEHFRFIDLFAGIGGFRIAMEAAGGECVFTSEIDRWAHETYRANFRTDHLVRGDIRQVHENDIPDFDVLVAGFPCQPFSIAGVSKKRALGQPEGFACDTQGTLFFDIARILDAHRPRAFLLENVRNLVSHDRGRTFSVILQTLQDELGYHVQTRIIDAAHWLPQHRERIFVVGFREETLFDFDDLRLPLDRPHVGRVLHPEDGTEFAESPYTTGSKARVSKRYTLSTHLWAYLREYAARHRARGNGFGYGMVEAGDTTRTLSARYYKDGSEILVNRGGRKSPRRLTPRECSRLMGFDGFTESSFQIPVSDTQAYKQFGNAVAAPVATAVAEHMAPHIHSHVAATMPRSLEDPRPAAAWMS